MYTYIDDLTAESFNLSFGYFPQTIFPVIISIGKLAEAWEAINTPIDTCLCPLMCTDMNTLFDP